MSDVFRSKYRGLTENEKGGIADAKGKACGLYSTFNGDAFPVTDADARYLALAKTRLEEAIMWYVKAVTG